MQLLVQAQALIGVQAQAARVLLQLAPVRLLELSLPYLKCILRLAQRKWKAHTTLSRLHSRWQPLMRVRQARAWLSMPLRLQAACLVARGP